MQLSIIIPTYNEVENIPKLIKRLREQAPLDQIEILVVDGGSKDNTVEIAEQSGLSVLHASLASRAHQLNLGAKAAQFATLYFVHADTLPPASYYSDIQEALSKGFDMGCYRFRFDSNRLLLRLNSWFTRFSALMFRGGDQSFFISKENFFRFGGYDEQFVVMEEYDFLRKTKAFLRFCIIPKDVIVSARKYRYNSYLRVNLANFIVFNMFRLGFKPQTIKTTYSKLIRHPKDQ